jgi:hypothetical protein
VYFSHLHVNHTIVNSNVDMGELVTNQIQEVVDVLEAPCGNGMWHIERCPLKLHVQCSMLQKSTKHSCATTIITKPIFIGVPAPTYLGLWFQFPNAPLKLHKFWFYVDDMNHYVGSTKCKHA